MIIPLLKTFGISMICAVTFRFIKKIAWVANEIDSKFCII